MTPEKFDEYVAMDRIVPFGDEKLCWTLANAAAAVCSRLNIIAAGTSGAKELKDLKPKDFIPWLKKKKQTAKDKFLNPNAMAAAFKMAVG